MAAPIADDPHAHPVTVLARGLDQPHAVVVDGAARAYVALERQMVAVPLGGGPTSVLADAARPLLGGASALVLDADGHTLVWADDGSPPSVRKVPTGGGAAQAAALLDLADAPVAVAVDGGDVFFATKDGTIRQIPAAGGDPVTLATGQGDVSALTADGEGIYWAVRADTDGAGRVRRIYRGGTGDVFEVAKAAGRIEALTMDTNCIVFTDSGPSLHEGAIRQVWKEETQVTDVATGQDEPVAIVRDEAAKSTYWLDRGASLGPVAAASGPPAAGAVGSLVQLSDALARPVVLAHGLTAPEGLAVSASAVVFTMGGGMLVAVKIVPN